MCEELNHFFVDIKHVKQPYNTANKHQHIAENLIKDFNWISWATSPWAFVNWLGSLGLGWQIYFTSYKINSNGYLNWTNVFRIQFISLEWLKYFWRWTSSPLDLTPWVGALKLPWGYIWHKLPRSNFMSLKPHLFSVAHIIHPK